MCGIMGVSFAPDSEINRHKLLSILLTEGEVRGRDAAGYAWVNPTGDGYYKKNVSGSKLHVGKLPADATAFIAHTRMATHGSPSDNDNNHPVTSPSGDIRLVHNGVIYNHMAVREILGETGKTLPEVDSSVIPAMLEVFGIDATEHIGGQAACAWFDRDTGDTLHLARFNGSPLHYAWLADGSFVFASTGEILGRALTKAGLAWYGTYPGPFESFTNGEYIQILSGDILQEAEVDWDTGYSKTGWRGVYGGGSENNRPAALTVAPKPATTATTTDPVGVPSPGEVGSTFYMESDRMSAADYEFWVNHGFSPDEMEFIDPDELVDPDDAIEEGGDTEDADTISSGHTFYLVEHDGDETTYRNLPDLITNLAWFGGMTADGEALVGPEEGLLRWVNTVADVGVLDDDEVTQISWVKDKGSLEEYEVPSFIREGLDKLRTMVGA